MTLDPSFLSPPLLSPPLHPERISLFTSNSVFYFLLIKETNHRLIRRDSDVDEQDEPFTEAFCG